MSKKQGRSRSLVRESDVADILSNWSDVLQNTSVCSLIDIYIYMYICTDSFLWTHRLCWVFISGCMTSVWTLRFNMFLTGKLGFAEGVKIGRAQTNDLLWWVPCFINVYCQGFIEQHSSLVFRTWCSPANLVFLWHPFLQSLKWNWLLQFDFEVAPSFTFKRISPLCFSKWPPSLRTVCILSWGIVPLQAVAMRVAWLNRTVIIGEVASNFQTLQRGKDRGK